MKKLRFFLFVVAFYPFVVAPAFAKSSLSGFQTPRDLLGGDLVSNISLQNNRSVSTTVYGLYVRQYAYVAPGQSCDSASVIYPATNNVAAGAFVAPTPIGPGKRVAVGGNYLYNMIYAAIYYENIIIPSSPPGCALPGCTWGSDTNQYNWCIYLGALSPVFASTGYTANVPPATEAASSSGLYDYNLISNYAYLGPISCDDKTLTCTTANLQTQAFS